MQISGNNVCKPWVLNSNIFPLSSNLRQSPSFFNSFCKIMGGFRSFFIESKLFQLVIEERGRF